MNTDAWENVNSHTKCMLKRNSPGCQWIVDSATCISCILFFQFSTHLGHLSYRWQSALFSSWLATHLTLVILGSLWSDAVYVLVPWLAPCRAQRFDISWKKTFLDAQICWPPRWYPGWHHGLYCAHLSEAWLATTSLVSAHLNPSHCVNTQSTALMKMRALFCKPTPVSFLKPGMVGQTVRSGCWLLYWYTVWRSVQFIRDISSGNQHLIHLCGWYVHSRYLPRTS